MSKCWCGREHGGKEPQWRYGWPKVNIEAVWRRQREIERNAVSRGTAEPDIGTGGRLSDEMAKGEPAEPPLLAEIEADLKDEGSRCYEAILNDARLLLAACRILVGIAQENPYADNVDEMIERALQGAKDAGK